MPTKSNGPAATITTGTVTMTTTTTAVALVVAVMLSTLVGRAAPLTCYSNLDCPGEETLCHVNCTSVMHHCLALFTYSVVPGVITNLQLLPSHQACALVNVNDTGYNSSNCLSVLQPPSLDGFFTCACNTDLCNVIDVTTDPTPSPDPGSLLPEALHPGVVRELPTNLSGSSLWCNYNSVNNDGVRVHGYQDCTADPGFVAAEDEDFRGCLALYVVNSSGYLVPSEQTCVHKFFNLCNLPTCQIDKYSVVSTPGKYTSSFYCCCNESWCNVDTPAVRSEQPVYNVAVTHVAHEEHLICEFASCSLDPYSNEYHCHTGLVVCSEHVLVTTGLASSNKSHHSCYSIKRPKLDENNRIVTTEDGNYELERVSAGCLPISEEECRFSNCTLARTDRNNKDEYSCCCSSTLCNQEPLTLSITILGDTDAPSTATFTEKYGVSMAVVVVVVILSVIGLVALTVIFVTIVACTQCRTKLLLKRSTSSSSDPALLSSASKIDSAANGCSFMHCDLLENIGRGRFSDVWKGDHKGEYLAIKIFANSDSHSWAEEVEMYKTPRLEHANILRFRGVYTSHSTVTSAYWIVCDYHAKGNLAHMLEKETLSLLQFLTMGISVGAGLSHLHKLSIAHRDLKSKNVLVKNDGQCCIGDLGLALKLEPGGMVGESHWQVGTTRYMSPEVLEGAVNFQSQSFLKIDIYALALILWEMTVRCNPNPNKEVEIQRYEQPYEAYLKSSPTISNMVDVVVRKGLRPDFMGYFECQKMEVVMKTIRECWDTDADARLGADTVVDRFTKVRNKVPLGQHGCNLPWEKSIYYEDDSTKKGSISNGYVSADCPSPSSVEYSSHSLNMVHPPGVISLGYDSNNGGGGGGGSVGARLSGGGSGSVAMFPSPLSPTSLYNNHHHHPSSSTADQFSSSTVGLISSSSSTGGRKPVGTQESTV